MNLKTKAVALLAGSALALSVATGAMAEGTSVTLNDGGTCNVGISSGDVDFGTYTWNGSAFVKDANGSGTITLSAQDTTKGQEGCDVTLSEGDMDDDATGLIVIDVDYSHGSTVAADSVTVSVVAGADETVTASIPGTLDNTYTIDGYSGTILVTQGSGA